MWINHHAAKDARETYTKIQRYAILMTKPHEKNKINGWASCLHAISICNSLSIIRTERKHDINCHKYNLFQTFLDISYAETVETQHLKYCLH